MKATVNFILFSLFFVPLFSQKEVIEIGTKHSMFSESLDQDRPYWIYLPDDYSEEGDPVAVIYLLDGEGHFHHTSGILDFLKRQNITSAVMLVAIPNTDNRTRDLTPPITKNLKAKNDFPTAGGADKMLSFIADELRPIIKKGYNVNEYEILIGHSFGGIFSIHALLKRPTLFDAHVSISPSLWWDDQSLVTQVDSFLRQTDSLDCFYYMTMGNEGGTMLGGAMKVAALFEEKSPKNFKWDFIKLEKETHGSVPHRSTYNGLEAIFSSWYKTDLSDTYAQAGWEGVNRHYANISQKLGYEKLPSESEINGLGYSLIGKGALAEAEKVFKENMVRFPNSYNVYDSYAEAQKELGNNQKAIVNYKKSLQLFPGNTNAVDMLSKLGVEFDISELFITLSKAELEKYTGKYKFNIGVPCELILEEGNLYITGEQIPKEKLMPFGNHKFCADQTRAFAKFIEEDGQIIGFDVQMGSGNSISAIRM